MKTVDLFHKLRFPVTSDHDVEVEVLAYDFRKVEEAFSKYYLVFRSVVSFEVDHPGFPISKTTVCYQIESGEDFILGTYETFLKKDSEKLEFSS